MIIKLALALTIAASSIKIPADTPLKDVILLARLGCSEAGNDFNEVRRVFRVVYNRSKRRNTSVMREATRKGQFYYKNCTGNTRSWLKWQHFELAIDTLNGTIRAKEASINNTAVIYFATTKRLSTKHRRCKGYTIREVWEWAGLRHVLTTEVGHEYFEKLRGKPGCPPKDGDAG